MKTDAERLAKDLKKYSDTATMRKAAAILKKDKDLRRRLLIHMFVADLYGMMRRDREKKNGGSR